MKTYRSVKTNQLNQDFGESKACAKMSITGVPYQPFIIQTKIGFTCPIGYRDFYALIGLNGHNGRDWAAYHGEPVYFADEFAGWMKTEHDRDGGLGVDIVSNEPIMKCMEPNCGQMHYIKRRLWHGLSVVGYDGKKVQMGDLVMFADSTGASSGDHLHTALKWCDKDGNGIHTDNGYMGAFPDPDPENRFVLEVINIQAQALTAIQLANKVILQVKLFIQSWTNKNS